MASEGAPPSGLPGSSSTGRLSSAASRSTFAAFRAPCLFPRHRVVHDGEFGGLEALDLVADAGGLFEVEVGGGVAHRLFQGVEMGLQVVADQVAALGKALAADAGNVGADVVALVDAVEDVGDVCLHRFRRDAVLGVVGHLLLAAAAGLAPWRAPSSR